MIVLPAIIIGTLRTRPNTTKNKLPLEAAAMAKVPLAGTNWIPGEKDKI